MSDPLTALMHAVQVMNLLKTLIMKTLRDREESVTGGYSPMSSRSSNQEIDEDFDSQQEMDMSCELRGEASDNDVNAPHNLGSEDEDEDEVESLGEIEESFLRQLDENNSATNSLSEQPENDLRLEHASPSSCMGSNVESGISGVSFTESKNGKSSSSSSDLEEDMGTSLIDVGSKVEEESPAAGCASTNDVEMMDKLESISPMPLFTST
jgi:hypothetical protein